MAMTRTMALACALLAAAAAAETYRGIRPTDENGRDGLRNPERGWRFEILVGSRPDDTWPSADGATETKWPFPKYACDGVTVSQAYCYLTQYFDRPIGQEKLDALQASFDRARRDGVKFLLRFAYECVPDSPGPTGEQILKHIAQLTPIVRKNIDVIYCLQTGWVGQWGEFHTSVNGIEKDPVLVGKIVKATLEMLPKGHFTMMRRVAYKRTALAQLGDSREIDAKTAWTDAPHARIGFFNDGTLANWHDGATFPGEEPYAAPGNGEFDQVMREGPYMPVDGELFWTDQADCRIFANALRAIERFRDQHYTTFSLVHGNSELDKSRNPGTIDLWKKTPVTADYLAEAGVDFDPDYFAGVPFRTGYEFIRDHLGYRLKLEEVTRKPEGDSLVVTARIHNYGFATPVKARQVVWAVVDAKGGVTEYPADAGCRTLLSGTTQAFTAKIPSLKAGERLALWLPDAASGLRLRPEYAIRLANALETRVVGGRLLHLL